jgi:hypothetical protein
METHYLSDEWWQTFDKETGEENNFYYVRCKQYNVEFEKMQMTIQLTQQTFDDECIDLLGDKYVYKLTESGFVIDRKEKAELGNKENPMYGTVYKRITDIPELKNYTSLGGGVIYPNEPENYDLRFGISNCKDENGNMIFFFEEFVEHDEKGRNPKFKILDTLNVGKLKTNEFAWYQQCRKYAAFDSEIIAIVIAGEYNYYEYHTVKAWRANTKTGKIQAIENLKGIYCVNEHDFEHYDRLE